MKDVATDYCKVSKKMSIYVNSPLKLLVLYLKCKKNKILHCSCTYHFFITASVTLGIKSNQMKSNQIKSQLLYCKHCH